MTLDDAKTALKNGALFSDVYTSLVLTCYNDGLAPDAITNAITELRRFFCYDLPLQEGFQSSPTAKRWKNQTAAPKALMASSNTPKLSRQAAKQQGYEGDPCTTCGGMRVRRNGACLLCEECQTSSGCS